MSLVREGAGCEFLPVSLSTHPAGQEKTDPEGKTEGSTALSIVVWGGREGHTAGRKPDSPNSQGPSRTLRRWPRCLPGACRARRRSAQTLG